MVKIAVVLELGAECLLTVTARELNTNRVVKTSFAARARRPVPRGAGTRPRRSGTGARALPPAPPPPTPARRLAGFFRRLLGREAR